MTPSPTAPPPAPPASLLARMVARPTFWLLALALPAAWPLVWALRTPLPPPLPVLGEVPRFELTSEQGRAFGSPELEGHVWIASFVFTRCDTICPAITSTMARVQSRARNLEPALHLVSFTVDPEHDTPARLAAYARGYRASPRLWTFLTGPADAVQRAVVSGLHAAMGNDAPPGAEPAIFHDTHLVLVDARGRIRGYYDSGDADAVTRVVRDAALLVNRGS
ncbi:hypothetical protein AMYX_15250 [Anaeromyxobacter diazotrophicus]|uniref:Electron transport protein SCO1/SenC n=2 Tax=Anaeromyxobacter diazotrophicus TaxID=2590199 RepID=A0A7I9VK61_9BACT|nr:hypothetical protein AMYX_15250 [Anaeromyxobacter diazotrophicus]